MKAVASARRAASPSSTPRTRQANRRTPPGAVGEYLQSDFMYSPTSSGRILGHELRRQSGRRHRHRVEASRLLDCDAVSTYRPLQPVPRHPHRALGVTPRRAAWPSSFRCPSRQAGLRSRRDSTRSTPASRAASVLLALALLLADTSPTPGWPSSSSCARPARLRRRPAGREPRHPPRIAQPATSSGTPPSASGQPPFPRRPLRDVVVDAPARQQPRPVRSSSSPPAANRRRSLVHLGHVELVLDYDFHNIHNREGGARVIPIPPPSSTAATRATRDEDCGGDAREDPESPRALLTHRFPLADAD